MDSLERGMDKEVFAEHTAIPAGSASWPRREPFLVQFLKEGHRSYAYADLCNTAPQVAQGLAQAGIGTGDVVGLLLPSALRGSQSAWES